MSDWSLDQARKTYSIPHWSDGYFDVDAAGHVVVRPTGAQGPAVSLPEIVDSARAAGAKLPLLVRFPDILGQRLGKLQAAFAQAQHDWDYTGGYTAVYPIKVNQHRGVAGTLASNWLAGLPAEFLGQYVGRIRAVDAAKLQAVAARYYAPDAQSVIVVGDRDAVAPQLAPFGAFGVEER